ncbi:hypothetical protein OOU_Y34scaffold00601g1 [Pyricularia oryzae Y34]|uniref:Uncharacterized protein n=2 Tax=Pyricularia oryzae TaxID=318829 RepID=A0AA97PJU9_PYRO3|nr:hypothetical protein OOU_Y34scaffold00601g1 [Pyricularia oryzae Y34]
MQVSLTRVLLAALLAGEAAAAPLPKFGDLFKPDPHGVDVTNPDDPFGFGGKHKRDEAEVASADESAEHGDEVDVADGGDDEPAVEKRDEAESTDADSADAADDEEPAVEKPCAAQ